MNTEITVITAEKKKKEKKGEKRSHNRKLTLQEKRI